MLFKKLINGLLQVSANLFKSLSESKKMLCGLVTPYDKNIISEVLTI